MEDLVMTTTGAEYCFYSPPVLEREERKNDPGLNDHNSYYSYFPPRSSKGFELLREACYFARDCIHYGRTNPRGRPRSSSHWLVVA